MPEHDEAYYLKNFELAVLLSMKGMTELFGIRIAGIQNPEKAAVYQALFALEKKKLLSAEEGGMTIKPRLDSLLDDIKNAEEMLYYTDRLAENPDQCIYLSREAVFLSGYGKSGEMNRLEGVSLDALPEKLCECGFHLENLASDEKLYRREEVIRPEMGAQAERLFGKEFCAAGADDWGAVTDCLRVFSLKEKRCVRQYVLIKDKLEDYIGVTDASGTKVYRYSKKKMAELLKKTVDK